MAAIVTLRVSCDVDANFLLEPSTLEPCLGKGARALAHETSGLEFVCGSQAGREAIGAIVTLWRKFDRCELPVAGFKCLEIARQLKQLLGILLETGSRRVAPTDILHQMASVCKEVAEMDALDNHAYAKVMDNFAVLRYGLENGRAMSPCNPQGIRFWYTITGKDYADIPGDNLSEDSWRVGADCPVLDSSEMDADSVSSGTSLSPTHSDDSDRGWSGLCPPMAEPAVINGATWVGKHKAHGRVLHQTVVPGVGRAHAAKRKGCGCGLMAALIRLFRRSKQ